MGPKGLGLWWELLHCGPPTPKPAWGVSRRPTRLGTQHGAGLGRARECPGRAKSGIPQGGGGGPFTDIECPVSGDPASHSGGSGSQGLGREGTEATPQGIPRKSLSSSF